MASVRQDSGPPGSLSDSRRNSESSLEAFAAPAACFSLMAFAAGDDDNSDGGAAAVAEQDAVAASNALVGETLLDAAPPSPRKRSLRRGLGDGRQPPRPLSCSVDEVDLPSPPTTPLGTTGSAGLSVGIMAHGLAWVQRTRDARRRRYLQHLAEQQLLKLRRAQEEDQQQQQHQKQQATGETSDGGFGRRLSQNPTFQSIMAASSNHSDNQRSVNDIHHHCRSNHQSPVSLSKAGGDSRRCLRDELARDEPAGNVDLGAVVSQSGDGYSVNLPLSEEQDDITINNNVSNVIDDPSFVPTVRVAEEPDWERHPLILSHREMQQVAETVLPTGIAYCRWIRLYSLVRDGDSFDACLRRVQDHTRTLLVLRTRQNQVLGGFADMPWKVDAGGASYYGGPDACLFKVVNSGHTENAMTDVKAFKWSGANRYIQLCDQAHKMIAFGGGGDNGAFGLAVEQDFLLGSTGTCETFRNEPLCDEETFEIVDLEIYGFLVGQF